MDESLHTFPICCDEVTKDGVRCDLCDYWHHNSRVEMPGDNYKVLGRSNDPKRFGVLQWLCPGCQRGASKVILILQNVVATQSKHGNKLSTIEEEIQDPY